MHKNRFFIGVFYLIFIEGGVPLSLFGRFKRSGEYRAKGHGGVLF